MRKETYELHSRQHRHRLKKLQSERKVEQYSNIVWKDSSPPGGNQSARKARRSTTDEEWIDIDVYGFLFPLESVNNRVLAKFPFVSAVWSKIELFAIRSQPSLASVVGWERSWKVRVQENRRNRGSRRIKKKGRKEWTVHFPLFSCGTSLFPPKVTRATRPLEELLNPRHFTGGSAQSWSCFLPFARVSSTHGTYRIKRRQQCLGINFPDAWEMRRTAVCSLLGTASPTKLQTVG